MIFTKSDEASFRLREIQLAQESRSRPRSTPLPVGDSLHYLVRLYLISILEHARAWLAEAGKVLGDDLCKLADLEQIRRLALA